MAEIVFEHDHKFELPPGVNIYRLRRPDTSQDAVSRVGGRFNLRPTIESGRFIVDAQGIAYSDRSGWGLKLSRLSGGWQYRHATRWQADDGQGRLVIDNEEAARLASDAMGRYALPTVPDAQLLRVERLHVAHAERGGAHHQQRIIGVRVLFARMLDGLRVEGLGGKTVVYLDHKRELTGIDHLWHDIEGVHEPVKALRPVEDAIAEVRRRYGSGDGRVEVTGLHLAYFELGWDQDQQYLQPAYVVFVRLLAEDPRIRMNAIVPVAAAVNAVGPIEPVPRAREPQARRAG
ncbi:MAG TPA: hypothetical protein VEK73_03545 [Xanthobacteraceae bacterium]|nr:hypothetical protein [Xanthobacteraceae bacterium]